MLHIRASWVFIATLFYYFASQMISDTLMLVASIESLNTASIDITEVYKYREVGDGGLKARSDKKNQVTSEWSKYNPLGIRYIEN
jgi:hypothetical protein